MTTSYADDDFFNSRFEADMEQAELEAAGRSIGKRLRASAKARAAGDYARAAALCPHGGGYPLNSPAATHNGDPHAGGQGFPKGAVRCFDCGAVLSGFRWHGPSTVLEPGKDKRAALALVEGKE